MLLKFLFALGVWLVVALLLELVGSLLAPDKIGVWLQNNNVLLGFLAGVIYFIWGYTPNRPVVR